MTTLTIDHSSTALDNALRHVRADHEAVMLEQDGHIIAVLVPPDAYLPTRDADIPEEFWQGLRESKAGIGVDMETALMRSTDKPDYRTISRVPTPLYPVLMRYFFAR